MKQWWLAGIIVLLVGVAGVLGYVLVRMQSGEFRSESMGRGWLGRLVEQERVERLWPEVTPRLAPSRATIRSAEVELAEGKLWRYDVDLIMATDLKALEVEGYYAGEAYVVGDAMERKMRVVFGNGSQAYIGEYEEEVGEGTVVWQYQNHTLLPQILKPGARVLVYVYVERDRGSSVVSLMEGLMEEMETREWGKTKVDGISVVAGQVAVGRQ